MNEPSLKLVACPCCRAPLYSLVWERFTSKWQVSNDSPSLGYDAEGSFMECRRCTRRVAIIEAPEHAEEPFFVAVRQNCRRCGADSPSP
jgi:hypothetical protein